MKKVMFEKLNEYYGNDSDLCVLDKATLLDPRFKNVSFLSPDCLLQEMATISPGVTESSSGDAQPPPNTR